MNSLPKKNFWKGKKILLTGGKGFLGGFVVKKLLEHGAEKKNIFIPTFEEYDLRKMENCLKAVKGVNIVLHLAGVAWGIEYSRKYPGKMFYDNAALALNILEASRLEGIEKFTGIGSVCEYPKFTPVPFEEKNLWLGYPEETNAPYAFAKKFMLVQSQAYRKEYGLNAIHLLLANLYGPGDRFESEFSHVIPALIKKVYEAKKNGEKFIEVWGSGKPSREFLYVEDAAEAIVLATEKYNKPDPINIGTGEEITIKDLYNLICKLMDFKGEIKWDVSKPDGQPRRKLSTTLAEKEFGFTAKTDFQTGLKNTIGWYLKTRNKSR